MLVAVGWAVASSRPTFSFRWIPWLGRMVGWLRAATFADVLGVLVDSDVPLDEGLELAGDASGDRQLARSAHDMAAAVRSGQSLRAASNQAELPAMLGWLMAAGQERGSLSAALHQAAETYRRRATHRAALVRVALPIVATVLLGGAVTVGFALLVFSPWISMIHKLAAM